MSFTLAVTPPPTAQFGFFPSDPSIFDSVQFDDFSSDPGGLGIQSEVWSFGDGTTATGCCPTHRFAVDADYTVKLTVTTPDGRSSSTSQVVHVKTHDVAITKLVVPQAAHPGQTRSLVAGISDLRYPETVQVQLFKSVPGGFQQVGTLTQSVPVLSGNRTTPFSFNYTFTSDDEVAGKVTFEAVATIIGARDAQPADNTVVALPTVVN
jgi:PKD repeat protein